MFGGLIALDILIVLFLSYVIGALARLVVPGPDPMSLTHTVAIGFAGSVVGAFSAWAALGGRFGDNGAAAFLVALAAGGLLVLAHRRWIRHEPWVVAPDWRWWARPTPPRRDF